MCGICGMFHYGDTKRRVEQATLKRMTDRIIHRGPDDEGFYCEGNLGFGFRRLSIIDLAGGHQPMADNDDTTMLIFNGEIYNFPELRRELERRGYTFRTNSDTEVILNGYREWGENVVQHLNGMFGFAIWDKIRKKLLIARDRMGIKLVYYRIDGGTVTFGSEIKPLLAVSTEKPEIDPTALNLFLRYRYTPSPLTIFKGVKKLAPGTMLVVENGEVAVKRWYAFKPDPFSHMPSVQEAEEELLRLYRQAVKRQLISDVPLGLLLSGGIDSGLLLGLMHEHGTDWPTFTVGYGESYKSDELSDAARTAQIYQARNVSTQLDQGTFEHNLSNIVALLEEPIASSSIVPMYYVCERARQDVKVALVGQGPDELFGGYRRHLGVRYGGLWRGIPAAIRQPASAFIRSLPRNESLKRSMYSLGVSDRMRRYQNVFSIMPGTQIDGLFKDGLITGDTGDTILDCWSDFNDLIENTDELGGFQYLEVQSTLPDELLMYADKLSMAHSLETRVPFLDHDVVEFVQQLDSSFKVRHGVSKWLHRRVCGNYLPREILRRKKRGFAVNVVDDWFRSSLAGRMNGILLDDNSLMYRYLEPPMVRRLMDEHVSGRNDNHKVLFSLIVLEEWLRQYVN